MTQNAKVRRNPGENFEDASSAEIELMVKVLQIVRLNMFGSEDGDHKVYAEITRFSHSCASNCQYTLCGRAIVCYARYDIPAGEELAISYYSTRDMEPTHERRHKYLEAKEFTCHCPRCDAIGDDTRQFDCIDPQCKGVMMVCQPINKKEVRFTNLPYTGVEYVEPHLLPCSVCHRPAPADYQTKMFEIENQLLELGPRIAQRFSDMMDERRRTEMEPLYKELLRLQIPPRHGASLPLLRVKWRVLHCMLLDGETRVMSLLPDAVMNHLKALESIAKPYGTNFADELTVVVAHCSKICLRPVFPPPQEKKMCKQALRMHLLLYGRHSRDAILDEVMFKCHEKLPSERSTEVCAFCEESPLRAALTLSRCSRCKQVVYCSAECQKAHWKLHKKGCKASAGGK